MNSNPTLETSLSFAGEVAPAAVGMSESGVHHIVEIFNRQLADGLHPGAQLVLLRHGQVVVDRFAGFAHVERLIKVTPDTPFLGYSVSKAFTGMCVHRLIEEGRIEWDAPIARYWPAWGCKGKEQATIRHAFVHKAGLPLRGLKTELLLLSWNWNMIMRYVASLKAEYEPGTRCAYHLVNYGYILGGVITHVTGLRPDVYMQKAIFGPVGMNNSYLGTPRKELKRAAKLYAGCKSYQLAVRVFNLPYVRSGVIPAANLSSTARDIARFYQMLLNGGTYAGQQIVRPETIAAATQLGYEGMDETLKCPIRWAHGFSLGGRITDDLAEVVTMGKNSSLRTFGHFGMASSMAWADPDADIVVVFTCNRLFDDNQANLRWQELSDAVWESIST
jgi:CubicO group peptidase (beta-lactamase class C family)